MGSRMSSEPAADQCIIERKGDSLVNQENSNG
jgi:hypothetical protein